MNFLFGAAFSVFKYVTAVSILMLLSAYLAGIRLARLSRRSRFPQARIIDDDSLIHASH